MNNLNSDSVSMVFITCCMERSPCGGFRLPHERLLNSKTDMRQMAYNGTVINKVKAIVI